MPTACSKRRAKGRSNLPTPHPKSRTDPRSKDTGPSSTRAITLSTCASPPMKKSRLALSSSAARLKRSWLTTPKYGSTSPHFLQLLRDSLITTSQDQQATTPDQPADCRVKVAAEKTWQAYRRHPKRQAEVRGSGRQPRAARCRHDPPPASIAPPSGDPWPSNWQIEAAPHKTAARPSVKVIGNAHSPPGHARP